MPYELILLETFVTWLDEQEEDLRLRTYAHLDLLEERGPLLSRPYADTLKGSRIANLKELRFKFGKAPIRILFAFDRSLIATAASHKYDSVYGKRCTTIHMC